MIVDMPTALPPHEIEKERAMIIRQIEDALSTDTKWLIAEVERFAPPPPVEPFAPIRIESEGAFYAHTS